MDKLLDTIIDDKYELRRMIGRGGMGAVYEGFHLQLQIPVAIKILHAQSTAMQESILRFRSEARFASTLKHPGIVTVMAFGMIENVGPYIVMELLNGKSLAEELEDTKTLPSGRFEAVFSQCCEALAHVHEQGYIHRDIKPSNIMLVKGADGQDCVKITDFGIAKLFGEQSVQALTRTGEILGTPLYMSPEQCSGKPVDQRTDVYSLGCVMYEALTGDPPFKADTPLDLMMKQLDTAPANPKTGNAFAGVVMHALEKDPEQRPQTAKALAVELADAAKGITTFKQKRQRKELKKLWIGLAAVVVAIAVPAFLFFKQPTAHEPNHVEKFIMDIDGYGGADRSKFALYDQAIDQTMRDFATEPDVYEDQMRQACRLQIMLTEWLEKDGNGTKGEKINAYKREIELLSAFEKRVKNGPFGISDTATKLAELLPPHSTARWDMLNLAEMHNDYEDILTQTKAKLLFADEMFATPDYQKASPLYDKAIMLSQNIVKASTPVQNALHEMELKSRLGRLQCAEVNNQLEAANEQVDAIVSSPWIEGSKRVRMEALLEAAALNADAGNVKRAQELLDKQPGRQVARISKGTGSGNDFTQFMGALRQYTKGRCDEANGDQASAQDHFKTGAAAVMDLQADNRVLRFWVERILAHAPKETIHKTSL